MCKAIAIILLLFYENAIDLSPNIFLKCSQRILNGSISYRMNLGPLILIVSCRTRADKGVGLCPVVQRKSPEKKGA